MAVQDQVSSPVDPQREAARAKREHRRERDREHHRDSRGSGQRRPQRLERESSVPHESEYAISTKQQQRNNKSRERSRGENRSSRGQHNSENNERPLSQHEPGTNISNTDLMHMENLEPYDVLFLSQAQQQEQQQRHLRQSHHSSNSTTPDVALQSQMISHRMHATQHAISASATGTSASGASSSHHHHRSSYHQHHPPRSQVSSVRLSNISSGGSSDLDSRKLTNICLMGKYYFLFVYLTESGTVARWKVSAKIQQLLNTLKKPKKRHLEEFYEDDDIELEMAANPKDPNAPNPEGSTMTPAVGPQLVIPAGLPRNLEAAIQRYGSATYKAPAATVLDPNGKMSITLTYGKLLSRSQKIAYALLNRVGFKNTDASVKPGDRVALVYPNNDPLSFMSAFYGCVMAGVVPVPIEVPITRRVRYHFSISYIKCHFLYV